MSPTQTPTETRSNAKNGLAEPGWVRKSGDYVTWLILLVATGLRVYRLSAQSIWWDEGHSLFVASHRLSEIPTIPAMDVHPPLYFWLLHIWTGWTGTSEFALRFLSLIFGVVTVTLMYRAGRDLLGPAGGWVAALIAALSPLYLAYSQEVRMYTLVSALSLLSLYLFSRYMRAGAGERAWRLPPYVAATAAGLYSHYFFGFLIIAQNLYWLGDLVISGRWRKTRECLLWAAGQAAVLLLLAPQVYTAARQVTSYKNTNLVPPELAEFAMSCWRAFTLGTNGGRDNPMAGAITWTAVIAAILAAGLLARYIPRPDRRVRFSDLTLWGLSFLLPLVLYYGVLQDRASFSPRYMIVVTPALYVLLAYAVWQLGRRWIPLGALCLALLLAGFAVGDYAYYSNPAYAKDETRELSAFLEEQAGRNDVVFIDVPHPLDYYYAGEAAQRYLFVDIHTIAGELTEAARGKDRVFFIQWRQSDTDPRGAVVFLLEKYGAPRGQKDFRGYNVVWYDLPEPAEFSLPGGLEPTHVNFGDRLFLIGQASGGRGQGATSTQAEVGQRSVPAGKAAWVTLQWQVPESACEGDPCLGEDYKAALYLEDARGHRAGQADKLLLSDRHLRTTGWAAGETALNVYTLPVAPGTPPGEYTVSAAVYRAGDAEPLPVLDERGAPQGISAPIGTLRVVRPENPPDPAGLPMQTRVEQPMDGILLLGYDLPSRTVQSGGELPLTLYWQAQQDVKDDYMVRLGLFDAGGKLQAKSTGRPANGTYPTTNWVSGEVVKDWSGFLVPPTTPSGEYELRVGLVEEGTEIPGIETPLGKITVEGRAHQFETPEIEQPVQADFGGRIRLLGYEQSYAPHAVTLTLYWQALTEMDKSYKVFTHLLGPDGTMLGQKDDIPGAGTLPTTGWLKDEVLADTYTIAVAASPVPDNSRLEVGLYEPVSGARLPVVDAEGQVIADHVTIPDVVLD